MELKISIIGFGEAAQTFTGDESWRAVTKGYDIKLQGPGSAEDLEVAFKARNVKAALTNLEAVSQATTVFSLVTADQAFDAAQETASHLSSDTLFLDMNSVAPGKKQASAELIEQAGGRYVDVAIMAPVQPAALNVPLLISGTHATDAAEQLTSSGFKNVRIVGDKIGQASSIKMVRSVMIKGIEALTAECFLAADAAGVTEEVLSSLGGDWSTRANYNLERMLVHGERRAAEMEEVCATLESVGISPQLTQGTVQRQRALGNIGSGSAPEALEDKLALIRTRQKANAA